MTPPQRHPYDPGDPYPETTFQGRCPLLVLLATPDADPEWAVKSAVALARQWAARGERVFLADLSFGRPRLHQTLALPNAEGMSDLFLYGASLKRIAQPARDGFFFASAGTPIADGTRVLGSPRWALLTQGFAKAGAHLVAYLPIDEPGSGDVLAHAQRVVLLAGANGRDPLEAAGSAASRLTAVYAPRIKGATATTSGSPAPARAAAPAHSGVAPGTSRKYGKPKGRGSFFSSTWRVLLVVGLSLLALVVVLVLTRVISVPWLASGAPSGEEAAPELTVGAPPTQGGGTAADTLAGSYFLTLGSYAEGVVAMLQAESLGERRSDLLFVVSPVEVNGEVFHRLLAGETEDSSASGLKESLGRTLSQENPADWMVRPGPLSFHLGTFPDFEAATARLTELHTLDIPAYMLRQAGPAAQGRFDVWAGAYADSVEASFLERRLDENGIVPILLRRTGELLPE